MSEEETSDHIDDSLRTQNMMNLLEEQWQHPYASSATKLRRITEFVVSLPKKYRTAGLTAIADHIANNLILHFLDTMAIFLQKAEQEGMGLEEREEYTNYVLTELFSKMVGINRLVCVQSLEELTALTAITVNLQGLSRADTAEEA